MRRREVRETVMKALYQWDVAGRDPRQALERLLADAGRDAGDAGYCWRLLAGVLRRRQVLDAAISRDAATWALERVGAVERSIMRIALFEIYFVHDVPTPVALDEAVALAKRFAGSGSGRFVNGILDAAARKEAPDEAEASDGGTAALEQSPSAGRDTGRRE